MQFSIQKITRLGFIVAIFALFSTQSLLAQTDVKIGNNPGNKTASAVLELESTTKGFLLPRMTAAQMTAISAPANGLAVYNTDQQCTFIYRGSSWVSLCDSATNGLTKSGSTISLGGALTGATTVTTTGTNTLAIAGLQGGAATDSIMTLDAASGVLKRRTVADVLSGAGNVWLLGGNTLAANQTIGSNNAFDFSVETNGTTRLTFSSLGAITQAAGGGQVTFTGNVDATNGLDVTNAALTANAGSTLTGVTNINATGSSGTNIGNASTTTTVLGATNINTTGSAATVIGNATSTTTITGPNVNVTGLTSGASTDSLVTVNGSGTLKKRTVADVVGSAITADNGLTKNTANNIQLGGTLLQATSINQGVFDLNFYGASGKVGIGSAAAPTSTLQVTGSQAASYRKVTGATTLAATDYIVLANATAGTVALTLPAASTCSGRMYYIGKTDESANAVTFSPALNLTETTTISSINFAKKYKIVSDGTNWWIYNE